MSSNLSSMKKLRRLVLLTVMCGVTTLCVVVMLVSAIILRLLHFVVDTSADRKEVCDRSVRMISRTVRAISRELSAKEPLEAAASDHKADVSPKYWPILDQILLTLGEQGYQEADRNKLKEKFEFLHSVGTSSDFKRMGNVLHLAITLHMEDVAEILIDSSSEYNIEDHAGMTPLHYAARYRCIATVKKLLALGVNVRLRCNSGDTALHSALCKGHEEIAEVLVNFDSGNNLQNSDGKTPLHLAAENGFIGVVRKLLDAGAPKHAQDRFGRTPAFYALAYGMEDVAKLLIDSDKEINLQDNTGLTPLHIAAGEGGVDAVKKLLLLNAHPHVRSNSGCYPLRVAIYQERANYNIVKMILSACAWRDIDIDFEDLRLDAEKTQYCIQQLSGYYAEIQQMKRTKVHRTFVSYYDLARSSVVKGALYLANKDIRNAVSRQDAFRNFPNYANLLSFSVRKAEIRRVLNNRCLKGFSLLTRNLPFLARINIDTVLLHLTERDMRNFIESFNF